MLKKKRRLPTVQDVANAAGVSTATVSRCLNEPDKLSELTRNRVMEAVNKLRYSPNFGARAIAANRTGIYGAIIPTMENSIFARGVEAFQKALVKHNKTLIVASSAYDPDLEKDQIQTLVARGADGLLLIGTARDPDIYTYLADRGIPVVIAWAISEDETQSYVGFDNFSASKQLVERAIGLGHRTFAHISAKTAGNDRARDRILGARAAISEAGIDPVALHVIETEYSINCGREAFRKLVSSPDLATLIICGNDVLAVGAVLEARDAGYDVPGEVSITGFDDIELSTVVAPSLTTVHVPHRDMGRIAAETLLSLVEDPNTLIRIVLDTYIVDRESLGRPPRRLPENTGG